MSRKQPRSRWRAVLDASLGERGVPTHCSLALDFQETYPSLRRPQVKNETISFTDSTTDERMTWKTPRRVRDWIQRFDDGEDPAPMPLILLKDDAEVRDASRKQSPSHTKPSAVATRGAEPPTNVPLMPVVIAAPRSHKRLGRVRRNVKPLLG